MAWSAAVGPGRDLVSDRTAAGGSGAPPLVAVTFDFWNTLVQADTSQTREARAARMLAAFADHDLGVSPDALDGAFDVAVAAFDAAWEANEPFTGHHGAAVVLDHLGIPDDHEGRPALVEAFVEASLGLPQDLAPGIDEVLPRLADAGLRLGIVCDVGMTPSWVLRSYLDEHDVLRWFDHWSFSDEVGAFKPSPVIFEHALAGLGIDDPARVAHVGDLRRTDVAGALGMGMVAVRYCGLFDDPGRPAPAGSAAVEAHHVVGDHRDLPAVLGLVGGTD